eukprot:SAG31_NODE_279_length_18600_cov_21.254527_6_plen_48_part_00
MLRLGAKVVLTFNNTRYVLNLDCRAHLPVLNLVRGVSVTGTGVYTLY